MKVFILTNVPVPYRVDFFNELGKECYLEVLFEQSASKQKHRSSSWFDDKFKNFKASFLNNDEDKNLLSKVVKYLKNNRKNIIIIMGYSLPAEIIAITWLRLHRIPFLLSCDGGFIKYKNDSKRVLKKFLVSSASGYLSTGNMTDEFLIYYGAKKELIYRIPFTTLFSGELLNELTTKDEKERLRADLKISESKVVISVGQFIKRKGYDVLIEACRGLENNVGIYIIGGEPTNEYINLKNSYNLNNLHFVGFKKKNELKKYYCASDIFVLPTREDIWGLVVNEAMGHGLPVITTDRCIAGLELIDEKNGRIVPIDDANSLRNAIRELLDDPDKLKEMGKNSLGRIKNYTIENMSREHIAIFNDFIAKNR